MKIAHCRLLLAAALAAAAIFPARAENALDACGNIKYVDGTLRPEDTVTVRHMGRDEPARRAMMLFDGDTIKVSGNASACASLDGIETCLDRDRPSLTVRGHALGLHSPQDDDFFMSLRLLFDTPLKPITYFVHVRGAPTATYHINEDTLAPAGKQFLPASAAKVALLWTGGPSELTVTLDKSVAARQPQGAYSSALIDIPARGSLHVATSNPVVAWDIVRSDGIPNPPWFTPSVPLSEAQRAVRAIWLIKDKQYAQWRLFAFTELATLADDGDFAAIQLWTAARNGQLTEFLGNGGMP